MQFLLKRRAPAALVMAALASASAIPARTPSQGPPSGFSLVRDLETAAAHAPFTGWIHQAPQGLVTLSLGSLWRVEGAGAPPTQLLDAVSAHLIRKTGSGPLVVAGVDPATREAGTWLIDGGSVAHRLAPSDLWILNGWDSRNVAEHGGVVLAKTPSSSPTYDGLWQLSPGHDPVRLGPSGGVPYGDDPTVAPSCGGIFPTSSGFLHCRYESSSAGVYVRNANHEVRVPGLEVLDLEGAHRFGKYLFVTALVTATGLGTSLVVLRSDGTAEGTEIFDTNRPRGPYFELAGRLAWLTEEPGGAWAVRSTDGESTPTILASGTQPLNPWPAGVAGDNFYLHRYHQTNDCTILAIDGHSGTSHEVDTGGRCPAGAVVDADQLGGPVAILRDGYVSSLWSLAVGAEGPLVTPPLPWLAEPALVPLDGDPFIPLATAGEIPRMARGVAGSLALWNGLGLGGTGGSFSRIVGEIEGETIIAATTEAAGATLWRSRGTSATTHPIAPTLATRCSRWWRSVPVQIGPNAVLDCVDPASPTTTVWIFDSLDKRLTLDIDLASIWGPPAVVALADHIVFGAADGLRSQPLDGGPPVPLVPTCEEPWIARLGNRALVLCHELSQTRAWTTDGTASGTHHLLEAGSGYVSLTRIGPKILVRASHNAWTTDGTVAGTVSIGQVGGALEAPEDATWTCLWALDRTIFRFDIETGERAVLAQPTGPIWRLAVAGSSTILPFIERQSSSTTILWRCDGTTAGTRALSTGPAWWGSDSTSAVVVGDRLWLSGQPTALSESLDQVSLRTGEVKNHLDRVLPVNDDFRLPTDYRAPLALKLAGGFLWTTFADPDHGREPWALRLPLFADGFESGDTSAWSSSGPVRSISGPLPRPPLARAGGAWKLDR